MNPDIVVCGAGIGGLATAHAVGALGLRVLVVEKQEVVRAIAKGEVFQPVALAALRSWGVEQRLAELGALRLNHVAVRDQNGKPLLALDYRELSGIDRQLLAHDHPTILTALAECLGPEIEVRRGVLAEELVRDSAGRVTGVVIKDRGKRHVIHAGLVVAADGVSSRLRRAAGIGGRRVDYSHKLLSFELSDVGDLPSDFSAYVTDRGMRLCYPLPGNRIRLYLQIGPDQLRGVAESELAAWCRASLAEVPALRWLTERVVTAVCTRQILPVSRFTAPRLIERGFALVGEAAHVVHPMAAQGMNTSVADAICLADELAAAGGLSASAVDVALAHYAERRATEIVHIGRMSHNATRMVTDTSWVGRYLGRSAARRTSANQRLLSAVRANMSGIDPRPLTKFDRLHQFGLLPDLGARRG